MSKQWFIRIGDELTDDVIVVVRGGISTQRSSGTTRCEIMRSTGPSGSRSSLLET